MKCITHVVNWIKNKGKQNKQESLKYQNQKQKLIWSSYNHSWKMCSASLLLVSTKKLDSINSWLNLLWASLANHTSLTRVFSTTVWKIFCYAKPRKHGKELSKVVIRHDVHHSAWDRLLPTQQYYVLNFLEMTQAACLGHPKALGRSILEVLVIHISNPG